MHGLAMIRRECGQVLLLILALVAGAPSSRSQTPPRLLVNGQRVVAHLRALAEFGKNPEGGISRLAYSDADRQAREYILTLMREAKLQASIDAAGNIVGRRAGSDARGAHRFVRRTAIRRSSTAAG